MIKLDMILEDIRRIDEMGMRNVKQIIGDHKTATGYFHKDLDGVASALGFKKYLEGYGVKTTEVFSINYGSAEYSAKKPKEGLTWMVDFAHGKPFINFWTDHHDSSHEISKDSKKSTSVSFVHTPSNAEYISQEISPRDLFPPEDLKIISMVDSADFLKNNITPEQVMNAAFGYDRTIDVERNRMMMGLVVNKLLLAYKGKKGFLEDLVMNANSSLVSMYVTIKDLAKKNGYKPTEEITAGLEDYVSKQKAKTQDKGKNPEGLKNGDSTVWGTTLVQYGGGGMFSGYDRYTPFKNNPDVDFLIIGWPMGLIQISKNPFKNGKNPAHLGDMAMGILNKKWKSKLSSKNVTLGDVKRIFEMDIKGNTDALGFTFEDLAALFSKSSIKGVDLEGEGSWTELIKKITNTKFGNLSRKQKELLDRITIPLWDLITAQSGGHRDITNIQGLSFYGKGYVDEVLKPIMKDFADEMKDKHLESN